LLQYNRRQVEGRGRLPPGRVPLTEDCPASTGYFRALGITLLAGRLFEPAPELNRAVQKWLSTSPQKAKPARLPGRRGGLTITYIRAAPDAEEQTRRVREWAQDVWAAWAGHQTLARRLIGEATR
jgi:hypothetical protein